LLISGLEGWYACCAIATPTEWTNYANSAKSSYKAYITLVVTTALILAPAAGGEAGDGEDTSVLSVGVDFFWIAVILLVAKLSNLIARYGLPPVLSELLVGVVLSNLMLVGFHFFEPVKNDIVIRFLAELGVVILLFQIGLESNVQKILQRPTQ
jgi:hypothetical protein